MSEAMEILWLGGDVQWLGAEGHHDLDAFFGAALDEYLFTVGDEWADLREDPFDGNVAYHAWFVERLIADRDPEDPEASFLDSVDEGTPGAKAWTMIATGA